MPHVTPNQQTRGTPRGVGVWKGVFVALAIVTAVQLIAAARGQTATLPESGYFNGSSSARKLEGKPAPELTVEDWFGTPVTLESLKGKVVLLSFWAAWCPPSVQCLPKNSELVDRFGGRGLVVVGVHHGAKHWAKAKEIARDKNLKYPLALDRGEGDQSTAGRYALQAFPMYALIDQAGRVRAADVHPDWLDRAIEQVLDEPEAAVAAADEFAPDVYAAGESRLDWLRRLEGKPAAALQPKRWVGDPVPPGALAGRVAVYYFFSPASCTPADLKQLSVLAQASGAAIVGICDGRRSADEVAALIAQHGLTFPVMLDDVGDSGPGSGSGRTTREFGIMMSPMLVVADRTGVLRAAGVRGEKLSTVVEKLSKESVGQSSPLSPVITNAAWRPGAAEK